MSYTYRYLVPGATLPFRKIIRRTRGRFTRITEPTGTFGFRYAIFQNRAGEVWIPIHDLTNETKAAISEP